MRQEYTTESQDRFAEIKRLVPSIRVNNTVTVTKALLHPTHACDLELPKLLGNINTSLVSYYYTPEYRQGY
jgi:hypothetical protein